MVEPGRIRLTQGVPAPVSPSSSLTLLGVEDSRCPEGVQCIWAGKIEYRLVLQSCGKTEAFMLSPANTAHQLQLAPARISLAPGQPPPRGPAAQSPVRSVDVDIAPN